MADVLCNEGSIDRLQDIIDDQANWAWILFSNNIVPALGTVWANLTECTFPGYARIAAAFGAAAAGAVDGAQASQPQMTFTCTGGGAAQNVFGYALVDTSVGVKIIFALQIPGAPKVMLNNGDAVLLTPNMTLRQG